MDHQKAKMTRMINMTPVALEVLLHYFYRGEPLKTENEAQERALDYLLHAKLLDLVASDEGSCYTISERGKVHVEGLCAMPLPEQKWVHP